MSISLPIARITTFCLWIEVKKKKNPLGRKSLWNNDQLLQMKWNSFLSYALATNLNPEDPQLPMLFITCLNIYFTPATQQPLRLRHLPPHLPVQGLTTARTPETHAMKKDWWDLSQTWVPPAFFCLFVFTIYKAHLNRLLLSRKEELVLKHKWRLFGNRLWYDIPCFEKKLRTP